MVLNHVWLINGMMETCLNQTDSICNVPCTSHSYRGYDQPLSPSLFYAASPTTHMCPWVSKTLLMHHWTSLTLICNLHNDWSWCQWEGLNWDGDPLGPCCRSHSCRFLMKAGRCVSWNWVLSIQIYFEKIVSFNGSDLNWYFYTPR